MLKFAAVLIFPALLAAGGFGLQLGEPKGDAVVVVRSAGCLDPAKAHITGTATGMVDGRRQTIALKLTPTQTPGEFGVTRQWPREGSFTLTFVGTNGAMTSRLEVDTAKLTLP